MVALKDIKKEETLTLNVVHVSGAGQAFLLNEVRFARASQEKDRDNCKEIESSA